MAHVKKSEKRRNDGTGMQQFVPIRVAESNVCKKSFVQ